MSYFPFITEDGVNHGAYKLESCLNAVVAKCEDGYVHCALMWSGVTCDECLENVRRNKKHRRRKHVANDLG